MLKARLCCIALERGRLNEIRQKKYYDHSHINEFTYLYNMLKAGIT